MTLTPVERGLTNIKNSKINIEEGGRYAEECIWSWLIFIMILTDKFDCWNELTTRLALKEWSHKSKVSKDEKQRWKVDTMKDKDRKAFELKS